MSTFRVTQRMMSHQAFGGLQASLSRLAKVQEQLSTGRTINRPSDDPTGATTAMRVRSSLAETKQYVRNAEDAKGWLDQADSTLSSMTDQVRRARDLALQGANQGAMGPAAREALAVEVDQIRAGLISSANAQYLDRPIFGGVTTGRVAYTPAGTVADAAALGTGTGVVRTIAGGAQVRVDVEGPDVFGDDSANDSVFNHLAALSTALRAGDSVGINTAIGALTADEKRIVNAQADIGARANRVENARSIATYSELTLTNALSEVENVDLAKAAVDLELQEVAYQAALGATSRVIRPSLLDFLR
jgi:flagellar hook-associated protein 3 FlgL